MSLYTDTVNWFSTTRPGAWIARRFAARAVQLGYLADGRDFVVVASNFGQARHPAWAHNLLANPAACVYVNGHDVGVDAQQVSDDEKTALWPRLVRVIPQFGVYATCTRRNIKVFRLSRGATS